ncbi:unnamed protein product [Arabis nemorensis]|uniref:MADS-box domain-containing protein n=1 Tax=Arabis nemorensis TaxID=586526 RepID=A0A565B6I9_9BRAS|nr:unnamed protein product [Arabis nemorensis]
MTRKKVKLAWVANENSRTMSLKKRRLGIVKKARELTILCDVRVCIIIFSPKETEPIVWPSVEAARDLLYDFFALPEIEKKRKETSLESYLKEKTKKVQEQLMKSRKKNTEYVVDQLMGQLHRGQRIVNLNLSEIYELLSFSKDKIMFYRKKLDFMQHPPMHLFEAQSEELKTTTNDVVMIGGGQGDERATKADEAVKMIIIGTARENQSHYLMDQWFFPTFEPPSSQIHQSTGMKMTYYSENPIPRNYLPKQGRYLSYQRTNP